MCLPKSVLVPGYLYKSLLSAVITIDQAMMPILMSCLRREPEKKSQRTLHSYCKYVSKTTIALILLQLSI